MEIRRKIVRNERFWKRIYRYYPSIGIIKIDLQRISFILCGHEIGHSLCLSSNRVYLEQPDQCAYAGIDNLEYEPGDDYYDLVNYKSIMNYFYQLRNGYGFGNADYSDGTNGEGDHNDWAGAKAGLGGFNTPKTYYIEYGARGNNSANLTPEGKFITN